VNFEIKNSGYSKKLIGGIVVTGGGAQLKHLTQLFEYMTGMDTRIGYPTEHLANTNDLDKLASPMYSTGIGLVLKGFEAAEKSGIDLLPKQEENPKAATQKAITHSNPRRSEGFFLKIRQSVGDFFDDKD
jgi:cell division protein FtsA